MTKFCLLLLQGRWFFFCMVQNGKYPFLIFKYCVYAAWYIL